MNGTKTFTVCITYARLNRTLGNKRLAQWVCHRLGSMGVNMASKGQKENVSEVTSSLWDIGAWATLKDDSGTKEQVISSLKRIENEVGSELIKSTYEELANHLMEMMETLYGYEGEEYGYRFHALLDFNAEVTKAARVN